MPSYTASQLAQAMREAGFPESSIPTGVAVAQAESGIRTEAQNISQTEQSIGIWQINLFAHPDVTRECASDLGCSTRAAFQISERGTNWNPWAAFTNGAWRRFFTSDDRPKEPTQPGPGQPGQGIVITQGPMPGRLPGEAPGTSAAPGKTATTSPPLDLFGIGAGLSKIGDSVKGVGDFFGELSKGSTWLRVGFVVGGLGAIIIGARLYLREGGTVEKPS